MGEELTTTLQTYLAELVPAVGAWSQHNFGDQGAYRPLIGIIEELGELDEAREFLDREKVLDAVGDTMIYMADYYFRSAKAEPDQDLRVRWDLGLTYRDVSEGTVGDATGITDIIKNLAHYHLKAEQKIRGADSTKVRRWCAEAIYHLDQICSFMGVSLQSVVAQTWSEVSKRDWKKNPKNAHEVAAKASSDVGDVLG